MALASCAKFRQEGDKLATTNLQVAHGLGQEVSVIALDSCGFGMVLACLGHALGVHIVAGGHDALTLLLGGTSGVLLDGRVRAILVVVADGLSPVTAARCSLARLLGGGHAVGAAASLGCIKLAARLAVLLGDIIANKSSL
jgi:hypothetical protein